MGFSAKQVQALRRNLDGRHIRTREANGRELSYIEGWYAISEANRIFGFDGWSRETVESRCVLARENRGTFLAVYVARVRITVQAEGATVVREGHGTGEGRGTSPGEVHDIALKAAETDATKRALATFGKPFGLELYRSGKAAAPQKPSSLSAVCPVRRKTPGRLSSGRYNADPAAVPLLWSSSRSGCAGLSTPRANTRLRTAILKSPAISRDLDCPAVPRTGPGQIDKSVLTIAEPKRLRDKAHLGSLLRNPVWSAAGSRPIRITCALLNREPSASR